ncbi:nucleolar GTP-binding protein 1, putative [Plasmodium sp. gorilla clade G3]|nr:nucleolar GTP-binding protein 1, putative [Plasmodium sp. gorilla clade G3]
MKESNLYRFKDIKPVVSAKELVDVVLSKTQRKTPTEIHKGFKITRIRNFYMRKVKICQELFRDKLQNIINDFPKLDDIHPFYSDLANILYDRDHYKLSLGQCSYVSKSLIRICHDYIKLLKFSSSLYKCKMLKISALGRMCKLVKKLQPSLLYLEEVRQNLSRLPSINPHKKTIILSGAPNVGKSSFMNIVSRANVDVQSYSFTTKNLYVGHFDYKLSKYQIIDTPGLLDRAFENRNTIEMTTITALAHINGVILFIIDISEECGLTIKEQIYLLYSIKSVFSNKSIVIGFNKIDKCNMDSLSIDNKLLIKQILDNVKNPIKFSSFSTLTGVGVEQAKITACDLLKNDQAESILLDQEQLLKTTKLGETKNNLNRTPFIPESVIRERKLLQEKTQSINSKSDLTNGDAIKLPCDQTNTTEENTNKQYTMRDIKLKKKNKSRQGYLSNRTDNKVLQIDLQNENGGAGVYSVDIRNNYDIKEEYKYDVIPEIYNGKNISDFIDMDIEKKLLELEKEEEELYDKDVNIDPLWFKTQHILKKMQLRLNTVRLNAKLKDQNVQIYNKRKKNIQDIEKKLIDLKLDKEKVIKSMTEKARNKNIQPITVKKQKVKKDISKKKQIINNIYNEENKLSKIFLSTSTELQRKKAYKLNKMAYKKITKGTKGEADRSIPSLKPRHLFSGKRSIGKTSRR